MSKIKTKKSKIYSFWNKPLSNPVSDELLGYTTSVHHQSPSEPIFQINDVVYAYGLSTPGVVMGWDSTVTTHGASRTYRVNFPSSDHTQDKIWESDLSTAPPVAVPSGFMYNVTGFSPVSYATTGLVYGWGNPEPEDTRIKGPSIGNRHYAIPLPLP